MVERCTKTVSLCLPSECTGCTACMSACPTQSITMKENLYAEIHPCVNVATCINCGLCERVCPILNKIEFNNPHDCYAAWRLNDSARIDSSSGGIAMLLAESVVKQEGVYYGVKFSRVNGVYFTRIDQYDEIAKTQGSKYVQADLGDTFKKIGNDLSCNRLVY